MVSNQEEKRRSPRIKLSIPLRYQVRGVPESRDVLSEDLSTGGLSFIVPNFIAPATHVMLELNILSKVLTSAGRVAWSVQIAHSDRYRSGIEFVELNLKERYYIGDYIDTCLNRF